MAPGAGSTHAVKLLLDEMLDREIAVQLRASGWDVEAVQEVADLQGLDDSSLLRAAHEASRALVTDNVIDFAPLHKRVLADAGHHSGLVFCKLTRSKKMIGAWVHSLDALLTSLQPEGTLDDECRWT